MYNIVKGCQPVPQIVLPDGPDGGLRAAPFNEVVEARAKPWCKLWEFDDMYVDPFPIDHPMLDTQDLAFPFTFQLRKLLRSYRWSTSIGVDNWSPRLLDHLDDWLLDVLCIVITSY